MKTKVFIVLVLLFTLLFTIVIFAANEKIDDPMLPTSSIVVTKDQYGKIEEFDDDFIAETAPDWEIVEEQIPQALPQTGGVPAEAFYITGGICIVSAILLLSRKNNPSSK